MGRGYKFELVPTDVEDVTERLVTSDHCADEVHQQIEEDPDGFFMELIGDRYPGYALASWEEIPEEEARKNDPFMLI
jgi:hypothetical protein